MAKLNCVVSGFFLIVAGTQSLWASTVSDELYRQRDQSEVQLSAAKKYYLGIVTARERSIRERAQALDYFGRLSTYEGEVAKTKLGRSSKDAQAIFESCIGATNHLSPELIGQELPEYVYWRSLCIGVWASNTGKLKLMGNLGRIKEMNALLQKGLEQYEQFDNYGFNRIQAGKFYKSKALKFLGLYEPEKARVLIEQAIQAGVENYFSYIIKAEILSLLKQKNEAKSTLQDGIDQLEQRMSDGALSELYRAENEIFLSTMKSMHKKL